VKDLIFIDPEDAVPIRSFVQIFGRGVHVVWPDDLLGGVLAELKKGRSHLALVRDVNNDDASQDPFYEIKGIITLEDIIEQILGDTIVDETDAFIDSSQKIKVERAESFEWARLRLLDSKIIDGSLTESEVQAVTAHLRVNYADSVKLLTDVQLRRLVAATPVSQLATAEREIGKELPDDLLYKKNEPSDECLLILSGKVTILVGSENFRSDLSAWSVLGRAALQTPTFTPDFTAYVSDGPCKCLRFKHNRFADAVDASAIERHIADSKFDSNGVPTTDTGSVVSGGGDTHSMGSAEAPNRREKLIANIFRKGSSTVLEESQERRAIPVQRQLGVHFSGVMDAGERSRKLKITDEDVEKIHEA
jgi:metal transporter CNNM